ncbi:MAG: tetratricopeptide repeat protein, partial [Acidobacteriia bacterium]|nr:tetratricopeptide repeat protein [Terriglobia bacterium]
LTMEWLEGETLERRIRRGALAEPEARNIALQICAGLAEAHRKGVIHGDLKGANVILVPIEEGKSYRAVITDFGLAHMPGADHLAGRSGSSGGTPGYMAPEQKSGAKASSASDIFSLGVILFEMLEGRRLDLVVAEQATTITMPVAGTRKPSSPGLVKSPAVHPKWDRIIARCLDPDPARRYPDAAEIAKALAPSQRRRLFLAAAAAALLAAITGLITYQSATAPAQSVRLAVLPFKTDAATAALGSGMLQDVSNSVSRIQGDAQTAFAMISLADAAKATHVLNTTLRQGSMIELVSVVTDASSGLHLREWKAEYLPEQTRYIPRALAGVVTATLGLPGLQEGNQVNQAARADFQQGLQLARRDSSMDAAVAALERAVLADPHTALTHAALAESQWWKYFQTKQPEWLHRASSSLRQAELRDPDAVPVHLLAGILKVNAGQHEQAMAEYRRAIQLEPRNGDAHRRLGQALEQTGQLQESEAERVRSTEVAPADYRNFQSLGAFYFQRGRFTEAVVPMTQAVRLAPQEAGPRFALGAVLKGLGRFAESEAELRKAVGLRDSSNALHELGSVLTYQRREDEAIPYFQRALHLAPDKYISWVYLGTCYRRLNRPAEALRANQKAKELAEVEVARTPRSGYTRSFLAYICARLGDSRRADMEIAQALQLSPDDSDTRLNAVFTYEALGRREDSVALLERMSPEALAVLSRWPDNESLRKDRRFAQLLEKHKIPKGEY